MDLHLGRGVRDQQSVLDRQFEVVDAVGEFDALDATQRFDVQDGEFPVAADERVARDGSAGRPDTPRSSDAPSRLSLSSGARVSATEASPW